MHLLDSPDTSEFTTTTSYIPPLFVYRAVLIVVRAIRRVYIISHNVVEGKHAVIHRLKS